MRYYPLPLAFKVAKAILGYPCPCLSCSPDGGQTKSREISDLAYDLAGLELATHWPPVPGAPDQGMPCPISVVSPR